MKRGDGLLAAAAPKGPATYSRAAIGAAVIATALLAAACGLGGGNSGILPAAPPAHPGPAPLYVAVGASETAGIGAAQPLRDGWPRVLYREAMPPETTFVNMGIPGATVADVLRQALAPTLELRPDVVTVWLNVNDILAGVSPAVFERDLSTLVGRLRAGGRTRVLVANTPPVDHLPSYLACRPDPPAGSPPCQAGAELPSPALVNASVDAYNLAIGRVAAATGARLVDLHATGLAARAAGAEAGLISDDGFHPNSEGHAAVARAFADVLRASGPVIAAGG